MRLSHRSGWLLVVGLLGVTAPPEPAVAANPPVALVALSMAGQGDYGTIKGRLVWGGSEVPATQEPGRERQGDQGPRGLRQGPADRLDGSWSSTPRPRASQFGFAYLVKPQGANPDAVKALLTKQPSVEIDQKNCEFIPYSWRCTRTRHSCSSRATR